MNPNNNNTQSGHLPETLSPLSLKGEGCHPVSGRSGGGFFLNFNTEKVQTITLDQLKDTQQENVPATGVPVNGITHYKLISSVINLCTEAGLHADVYDLFAAQNKSKEAPGVSLYPALEAKHGERAVEAHVLRRVYANIRLTDYDTDVFTTNLAISYHQKGIEIGMGNCIKICHNQMMLGTNSKDARYINTLGRGSTDIDGLLQTVRSWLITAEDYLNAEREHIQRLKQTPITYLDFQRFVGLLTMKRVLCDTSIASIRDKDNYPLSGSQINRFTELTFLRLSEQGQLTAFDLYDIATELLKPTRYGDNDIAIPQMEIPNILSQNLRFAEMIESC